MKFVRMFFVVAAVFSIVSVAEAPWPRRGAGSTSESQSAPVDDAPVNEVEKALLHKINLERVAHGVAELVLSPIVHARARRHCKWMAAVGRFIHSNDGAENIAMGQADVDDAVNSWMNSPGHRANILNPNYTATGVAAYRSASGVMYWCQQFK